MRELYFQDQLNLCFICDLLPLEDYQLYSRDILTVKFPVKFPPVIISQDLVSTVLVYRLKWIIHTFVVKLSHSYTRSRKVELQCWLACYSAVTDPL